MNKDLQHYKELARAANARGDQFRVSMIIGLHLEQLFGDDHRGARAFYTELERTVLSPSSYQPMKDD
jgi:hypothetical protein